MVKNNTRSNQRGFLLLECAAAIFLISILMVSFSEIFFECANSIIITREKAYALNVAQTYAEIIANIEEDELFKEYYEGDFADGQFYVKTHINVIAKRAYRNGSSKGTIQITVLVFKNGELLAELKTFRKARWENVE